MGAFCCRSDKKNPILYLTDQNERLEDCKKYFEEYSVTISLGDCELLKKPLKLKSFFNNDSMNSIIHLFVYKPEFLYWLKQNYEQIKLNQSLEIMKLWLTVFYLAKKKKSRISSAGFLSYFLMKKNFYFTSNTLVDDVLKNMMDDLIQCERVLDVKILEKIMLVKFFAKCKCLSCLHTFDYDKILYEIPLTYVQDKSMEDCILSGLVEESKLRCSATCCEHQDLAFSKITIKFPKYIIINCRSVSITKVSDLADVSMLKLDGKTYHFKEALVYSENTEGRHHYVVRSFKKMNWLILDNDNTVVISKDYLFEETINFKYLVYAQNQYFLQAYTDQTNQHLFELFPQFQINQ